MHLDLQIKEIFDILVRLQEEQDQELGYPPYQVVNFHLLLHQAHFLACFPQLLVLHSDHLFDLDFLVQLQYLVG